MGLHHRKLIPDLCTAFCNQTQSCCSTSTNNNLRNDFYHYPPPTLPIFPHQDHHSLEVSTFLMITIILLASSFLVLFCFAIYASFFSRRRSLQRIEETRDVFFDEEHGTMVDHPFWCVQPYGLQQSIISEIAVCKYKTGEGLVEGTECSVCLNEFEEDENLRLLPKCNHAFHLPCIDTWLTSHTNCPLCRAPIVTNPDDSSSMKDTQMESLDDGGGNNGGLGMRNEAEEEEEKEVEEGRRMCEVSDVAEVENVKGRRISVSLDSSTSNLNPAVVTAMSGEYGDGSSKKVMRTRRSYSSFTRRSLRNVGSSMKKSSSYNGKHLV